MVYLLTYPKEAINKPFVYELNIMEVFLVIDYLAASREELLKEQETLNKEYQQFKDMNLKLDMSRGKPAPEQLDLSLPLLSISEYMSPSGIDTRNYGNLDGIPEAKELMGSILGVDSSDVLVGGNSSLSLMFKLVTMGLRNGFVDSPKPWVEIDHPKFICPVPGYDRHFKVTESLGVEMINVPMTPTGPDMDIVEELVKDETVVGMWCVPVYSNPDGYVYSAETVERLAKMQTGAKDFRIFWDNAYGVHHLTNKANTCPNLLATCTAAGHANRAFMFASTSKITFAGSGISALASSPENLKYITKILGYSTICYDKLNQLRHTIFIEQEGGVAAHMQKHATILKPKFDKVLEILNDDLQPCGEIASWTSPEGGYFISLYLLDGCATRTVELCKQAGVVLTGAGAAYPYGKDPQDHHIRIAPTYPTLAELETATNLLCTTSRMASIEKLLNA